MKRTLQIVLPIAILGFCGFIAYLIIASSEEPERPSFPAPNPNVVVRPLEKQDFRITLHSQGTVKARTESSLIPEVRGRIVSISPNFQEGAFFEAGDVLLEIDDRDYRTELTVARATLAQAELTLAQERARYEQASRDWERLNPGQPATELALREPQIRQARAAIASAEARVETAELNLQRTKVTAPYAGRILSKSVDIGQFVSTGNELARIYAVDFAEVRLPLTATQIGYLDLPSIYRGSNPSFENGPLVKLISTIGGKSYTWEGRVVRSEGAVDTRTRQLFVVAQVENPYGETVAGRPPLKVGAFVEAEIEGVVLEKVFVIPRKLYRENSYVLVVTPDSYLERRNVTTVWENRDSIVVSGGLRSGDQLCLTDVPYALEGWEVAASLESNQEPEIMVAQGEPTQRKRRPKPSGPSSLDARVDEVIAAAGETMPEDLKGELVALKGSNNWPGFGQVMSKVAAWADENGIKLPQSRSGGERPRS